MALGWAYRHWEIIRTLSIQYDARRTVNEQVDLAAQFKKLHRDNLWTKWVGGLLILLLSVLVLLGRIHHPKTVEATQFLLKDSAGNIVASLGQMEFGGTCLTLTAKAHAADAELCVHDDDSSSLSLLEHRGDSRVLLSPGFQTYEPSMRFAPGLYIGEDLGKNYLNISLGTETKLVIGHGSSESVFISSGGDKPAISLFGSDGKKAWSTH